MKYIFSSFIVGVIILISCRLANESTGLVINSGATQGTYYNIRYYAETDLRDGIDSLLGRFMLSASTYIDSSFISKVNAADSILLTDRDFKTILKSALQIANETNGYFDPTVGSLVNAYGFGKPERMLVTDRIRDSLMAFTGFTKLLIRNDSMLVKADRRMQIDLNAIAKGYAVDLVGRYLSSKGISRFLVDIGGEVYASGVKPDGSNWQVGIERPTEHLDDKREVKETLQLLNRAIATSGNYRNFYEAGGAKYVHTIDPETGLPARNNLLSASVLAIDCMTADAYATAFMAMGIERATQFVESRPFLDVYFIYASESGEMQTYCTKGFEAIICR